jgi:hypothetical protein
MKEDRSSADHAGLPDVPDAGHQPLSVPRSGSLRKHERGKRGQENSFPQHPKDT